MSADGEFEATWRGGRDVGQVAVLSYVFSALSCLRFYGGISREFQEAHFCNYGYLPKRPIAIPEFCHGIESIREVSWEPEVYQEVIFHGEWVPLISKGDLFLGHRDIEHVLFKVFG